MIFYFTATGNSLFAARELAEPDEEIISIPQAARHSPVTYEANRIIVVSPVFCHVLPSIVQRFIAENHFETDYFAVILTYGNRLRGAAEYVRDSCREAGCRVDHVATILMVDNFLPTYDMAEQLKLDKHIDKQLAAVREQLARRACHVEPATKEDRAGHQAVVEQMAHLQKLADTNRLFLVDAASCSSCGTCARVCPRGKITLHDRLPIQLEGDCELCLACIQNCPCNAIGFTIDELNPRARFRNPEVSLSDIIAANEQ